MNIDQLLSSFRDPNFFIGKRLGGMKTKVVKNNIQYNFATPLVEYGVNVHNSCVSLLIPPLFYRIRNRSSGMSLWPMETV